MELRLHHIIDHLYDIFLENDGLKNCAQLLEEEVNKMFGTKYLNDEHGGNIASINSLNIHDANDTQSHKLGGVPTPLGRATRPCGPRRHPLA